MNANGPTNIQSLKAAVYRIPTDAPESDGTLEWDHTDLIVVHAAAAAQTGLGWTYASSAAATLIVITLLPAVVNQSVVSIEGIWQDMGRRFRNIGCGGVGMMAVSAVYTALWDLKARLLGIPLVHLLGSCRDEVAIYGSGGTTTTGGGIGAGANAVAVDSSGYIYAAGQETVSGGDTEIALAKYNSTGTLSWGSVTTTALGAYSGANAVAVDSSGNVFVGGFGTDSPGYQQYLALAKYSSSGSLDTTFGSGGIAHFYVGDHAGIDAIELLSSGDILVGGYGDDPDDDYAQKIVLAELTSSGALDTTFGSSGETITDVGGNAAANAVNVLSSGKILVSGFGTDTGGSQDMLVARYTSSGALDTTFGAGGTDYTLTRYVDSAVSNAIAVDSSTGKIVIVGTVSPDTSAPHLVLARYNSNGTLDTTFGSSGKITTSSVSVTGYGVIVEPNSSVLVSGLGTDTLDNQDMMLVRYTAAGKIDTTFGPKGAIFAPIGTSAAATAMYVLSSGTVILAGSAVVSGSDCIALSEMEPITVTADLGYDYNGNTTIDSIGTTYTYDAWNRQATAIPASGGNHEEYYTYNALGERVTDLDGVKSGVGPVLVINNGTSQDANVDHLSVIFDQPVTLTSTGALTLKKQDGTGSYSITITATYSNPSLDGRDWVITLTDTDTSHVLDGSLTDGIYEVNIIHGDVTYVAGGTMASDKSFGFVRLYGDFDGNGKVTSGDLSMLGNYSGTTNSSPNWLWYIDSNGDGMISFSDLLAISSREEESLSAGSDGYLFVGASTTEGVGLGTEMAGLAPRDLYYSSQWQVIQETANDPNTGTSQVADQYVWGAAYVNELVERDADTDGSTSTGNLGISGSGLDQRVFALQDANYNVVALVALNSSSQWVVVQRYEYDAYGKQTVLAASGNVLTTQDLYSLGYGYQGGRMDFATGLVDFQHRDYSPTEGKWLEEDPAQYIEGMDLYQLCASNPIGRVDPYGLDGQSVQKDDPSTQPTGPTTEPISGGTVVSNGGGVQIKVPGGTFQNLQSGQQQRLNPGDEIRTGPKGSATFSPGDGEDDIIIERLLDYKVGEGFGPGMTFGRVSKDTDSVAKPHDGCIGTPAWITSNSLWQKSRAARRSGFWPRARRDDEAYCSQIR